MERAMLGRGNSLTRAWQSWRFCVFDEWRPRMVGVRGTEAGRRRERAGRQGDLGIESPRRCLWGRGQ